MAFANIGVWTLSEAFEEILEEYASGGGSATDIADIIDQVINDNGFDGF